jgi:hypothetical protein
MGWTAKGLPGTKDNNGHRTRGKLLNQVLHDWYGSPHIMGLVEVVGQSVTRGGQECIKYDYFGGENLEDTMWKTQTQMEG